MKRLLALFLVCVMVLCCACGKSDKKDDYKSDSEVDFHTDEDLNEGTKFEVTVDVSETADEIAKVYPKADEKSYYKQFMTEAPAEVFMAYDEGDEDCEKYRGNPYSFEGTVIKIFDDYDNLVDVFGYDTDFEGVENVKMNAAVVRVDTTDVLVINLLTELISEYKEWYKDDLMQIKVMKTIYNKLQDYDDFPTEGEKVRIYGFYGGFDKKSEMPVFTYGISKMVQHGLFGQDYDKFRTEDKKTLKYKNYVDFTCPKMWSDVMESSDYNYYYFEDGSILWDYYDNDDGMTLAEFVDLFYEGWEGDENLNYISREFVPIAKGKIDAHWVKYTYAVGNDRFGHYESILFEHKGKFILLRLFEYGNQDDITNLLNDFYDLVDSIVLRGA